MAKAVETAEAKGKLADLAGRVAARGKRIIVQQRGKPVAVLIGIEEYGRLQDHGRRRQPALPPVLVERQKALVARARRLRARHGDPVGGLAELLKSLPPATDPFWAEIAQEPF